ncbi:unnamed protein product [Prorocentrum cordatum]|uniref:Uncharacterized protein n=1 Tax=Prorocentrum cordatum TaxID=2364126 RepID=A0ABN9TYF8_9DINO|nr:unnamed protein product [Polarella glacialis]
MTCLVSTVGMVAANVFDSMRSGSLYPITYIQLATVIVFFMTVLVSERIWGLTRIFKMTVVVAMYFVSVFIVVLSRPLDNLQMFVILTLDCATIVQTNEDELALQGLLNVVWCMCFSTRCL